jgi:hypothetical protein
MAKDLLSTTAPGALSVTDAEFVQQMLTGLVEVRATTVLEAGGGKPILKMPEGGIWLFGQDDAPVQEGSHWCINVKTMRWGWGVWTEEDGKNRKHVVDASVWQPMPPRPMSVGGKTFSNHFSFDLVCLDGEDEGVEVSYGANTFGIAKAFPKLRDAIIAQLQRDPAYPCPVVTLSSETYRNNYGQQYNPIFNITGWADLGGNLAPTGPAAKPVAPPQPATAAATTRKRKPPLIVDPSTEEPWEAPAPGMHKFTDANGPEAPVSTQQAHTGQRRRHRPTAS